MSCMTGVEVFNTCRHRTQDRFIIELKLVCFPFWYLKHVICSNLYLMFTVPEDRSSVIGLCETNF